MGRCVVAVIGGLAIAASIAGSSSAGEGTGSCFPKGSTTLLENGLVRVYAEKGNAPGRSFSQISGCLLSSGEIADIDAPFDAVFAFTPPAMSLKGTVVGYAVDLCPPDESCETGVAVVDVIQARNLSGGPAAAGRGKQRVKVGSLRAKANGAVAWITCPERGDPNNLYAQRRPNCVRPGDRNSVYKRDAGQNAPRLLARGSEIDPGSLRRSGSTISWRDGNERKTASLN